MFDDIHTQAFIQEHLQSDVNALLLQKSRFPNVDWEYAIAQIEGRQRALQKLPTFAQNRNLVFPKKISLEQSSSELTADYKSSFATHKRVLDATGGLGIDSFYLSKQAQSVIYVEQQNELCEIAKHNFKHLDAKNITVEHTNCIDFLRQNSTHYDLIYIDPARRGAHNSKKFLLSDCEPNIIEHLDFFFEKADEILIKTSPMLDISLAMEQLRDVAEVHVIAVKNECKEILFLCKKDTAFRGITCVNLDVNSDVKNTILSSPIHFMPDEERDAIPVYTDFSEDFPRYIYDPFVCLSKAGAFKILCARFGVEKISQHAHLYTSHNYVANFPGRHFKIVPHADDVNVAGVQNFAPLPIHKKSFSKPPINGRANIVCKHFPLTPDEIRKAYKIADGGAFFLFFTTDRNGKKICLVAERVDS